MTEKEGGKPAIELKRLSFAYGQNRIFEEVDISVNQGEVIGLVGLSGSGKTTLIRIINGAMSREGHYDYTGEVLVHGCDVRHDKHINRRIGTVYQDVDNQLIFTSVIDEIVFGMENHCLSQEDMRQRLDRVVETLGIEPLLYKNPNNLSGGEKQLVVIACILCLDVDIIILDEALSGVDQQSRTVIMRIIGTLKKQNLTVVMIEHDFGNLECADRVFCVHGKKILEEVD